MHLKPARTYFRRRSVSHDYGSLSDVGEKNAHCAASALALLLLSVSSDNSTAAAQRSEREEEVQSVVLFFTHGQR